MKSLEVNKNGILIKGENAYPKILSNLIENNKKWGIKLSEGSKAEISKRNNVMKNYNQGILIVEGWSAIISDNLVSSNLKANIAYGGLGSQYTRIENNEINGSVAEGIFVVEGHKETVIRDNKIKENKDGIVFYNSDGSVRDNEITQNQRSGILTGGQTEAEFINNKITDNISIGVMIKDPSAPKLRDNEIKNNSYFQMSLEKKGKRLDNYLKFNDIEGKNELPKSTCSIL